MTNGQPTVTVYWRPGCGFCASLFVRLQEDQIPHERRNIWKDNEAAAFVRSVARGNETVPTVTIGRKSLVNPSIHEIRKQLAKHAE